MSPKPTQTPLSLYEIVLKKKSQVLYIQRKEMPPTYKSVMVPIKKL